MLKYILAGGLLAYIVYLAITLHGNDVEHDTELDAMMEHQYNVQQEAK